MVWSGGDGDGVRYAYVEPPGGPAAIIEIMESNEATTGLADFVRAAADGWDGAEPIRKPARRVTTSAASTPLAGTRILVTAVRGPSRALGYPASQRELEGTAQTGHRLVIPSNRMRRIADLRRDAVGASRAIMRSVAVAVTSTAGTP